MNKSKNVKKKKFIKPELKKHGPISKISQGESKGNFDDAQPFPYDRMMCLTPPPSIEEHRLLLADENCQGSFAKLIADTVKPGHIVLDLGTGSGIHAFSAIRSGASHVYAVDSDYVVRFAEKAAKRNGFSDRITFFDCDFNNLNLPTRVDVIISNIGFLQSVEQLPVIAKKHLAQGGRMIPDATKISFLPVCVPDFYRRHVDQWTDSKYGFRFDDFREMALHHPMYLHLSETEFLSEAWETPSLSLSETGQAALTWEFQAQISHSGLCHGLGGWYSFLSQNKVIMTTKPPLELNPQIWSHFLLPFQKPVEVKCGDQMQFSVSFIKNGPHGSPIWSWQYKNNNGPTTTHSGFYLFKDSLL